MIGVKAVDCNTGDVLAEVQEQAAGKESLLKALDAAAVSLRANSVNRSARCRNTRHHWRKQPRLTGGSESI